MKQKIFLILFILFCKKEIPIESPKIEVKEEKLIPKYLAIAKNQNGIDYYSDEEGKNLLGKIKFREEFFFDFDIDYTKEFYQIKYLNKIVFIKFNGASDFLLYSNNKVNSNLIYSITKKGELYSSLNIHSKKLITLNLNERIYPSKIIALTPFSLESKRGVDQKFVFWYQIEIDTEIGYIPNEYITVLKKVEDFDRKYSDKSNVLYLKPNSEIFEKLKSNEIILSKKKVTNKKKLYSEYSFIHNENRIYHLKDFENDYFISEKDLSSVKDIESEFEPKKLSKVEMIIINQIRNKMENENIYLNYSNSKAIELFKNYYYMKTRNGLEGMYIYFILKKEKNRFKLLSEFVSEKELKVFDLDRDGVSEIIYYDQFRSHRSSLYIKYYHYDNIHELDFKNLDFKNHDAVLTNVYINGLIKIGIAENWGMKKIINSDYFKFQKGKLTKVQLSKNQIQNLKSIFKAE